MLGRLFAKGFSSPVVEGEEHNPSVPMSYLEEADTRNLLYGPPVISTAEGKLDFNRDLRVTIVCDYPSCEAVLFDSAAYQETSGHQNSLAETDIAGTIPFQRISGGLAKSFSSMALSTSLTPLINGDISNAPRAHRRSSSGQGVMTSSYSSGPRAGHDNPTSATSAYLHHYKDMPDALPLSLLRQIVFGYAPLRFSQPITKLHLLPQTSMSNKTNCWLISQLFKIKILATDLSSEPQIRRREQSSYTRFAGSHSSSRGSSSVKLDDDPSKLTWNPQSIYLADSMDDLSQTNSSSSASRPEFQEVRCGICIYFSPPKDNPNMLTNHWEEIMHALLELQTAVSKRLLDFLGSISQEGPDTLAPTRKTLNRKYSLVNDVQLIKSAERFRIRVYKGLRIPRVLCGQDRWGELFRELKWAVPRFEVVENEVDFIGSVICYFVLLNKGLIQGHLEHGKEPPVRTVLVANNRIFARKLIFILTSLIHDRSSKQFSEQHFDYFNDETGMNGARSPFVDYEPGTKSISRAASIFGESTGSTKLTNDKNGWEITTSSCRTEFSTAHAVPYMVRPSASPSQSLSRSLQKSYSRNRLSSIDGFYRSVASSGSLFSSKASDNTMWSPSSSVFDEDLPDYPGFEGPIPPINASRPTLHRMNSSERTVDTISTIDTIGSDIIPTEDKFISSPLFSVYSNESGVLDIKIEDLEMFDPNIKPVILGPVAGHIQEFHPDYVVQAVPNYKELEENITRAMFGDGRMWGNQSTSCEDNVLSTALIIHLRKREVYEWTLVESKSVSGSGSGTTETEYQRKLIRRNMYPTWKQTGNNCYDHCQLVAKQLSDLLNASTEHPTTEELNSLKSSFLSCFDLYND